MDDLALGNMQILHEESCHAPYQCAGIGGLVVISFYTPDDYYKNCAKNLTAECKRFDVRHDIIEISMSDAETWADICRKKIKFFKDMLLKHQCDVLWVDVDTHLQRDPRPLHEGHFDMALFARAFKYFPRNETLSMSRLFHPGYIILRNTDKTHKFLDDCIKIEETHSGSFTDDYILEEAFRTSEVQMRLMILSPDDIEREGGKANPNAFFHHGESGNVDKFMGEVRQHEPHLMSGRNQKKVIMAAVAAARQDGREQDAMIFLRYLRDILPEDKDTHIKYLEILRKNGEEDAISQEIARGLSSPQLKGFSLRFLLFNALSSGDWDRADSLYWDLQNAGNAELVAMARMRMFRASLDRRAQIASIPIKRRPRIYWRESPHSGVIGEVINPYVVEKLSGIIPRHTIGGKGLCGAGTLDNIAKTGTSVWGSGVSSKNTLPAADAVYHAVRGPLSREKVISVGGTCPEIYGDCAALLPLTYCPNVSLSHETGFIVSDSQHVDGLNSIENIHAFHMLPEDFTDIEMFIQKILSCRRIISSALYGIIIAHAYGIPAAWAMYGKAARDHFEFRDYFASVGLADDVVPYNINGDKAALSRIPDEMFLLPKRRISLTALLTAAPFPVAAKFFELAKRADIADQPLARQNA